jgi:hypothetical protein
MDIPGSSAGQLTALILYRFLDAGNNEALGTLSEPSKKRQRTK